jgi:pyruvate dehydrogenase (quinone)
MRDPSRRLFESSGEAQSSKWLVETIQDWGADVVFGLPGDGINGIMEERREKSHFIQVRHERPAVFIACAYAKSPASLASVSPPPVPAAFTSWTASDDAKLDGAPVPRSHR